MCFSQSKGIKLDWTNGGLITVNKRKNSKTKLQKMCFNTKTQYKIIGTVKEKLK